MVFIRTKCNRMDLIRNLNLWGTDLQDVSLLKRMPNLEVLSLSVNRVSSLADLRDCPKLAELYLRKNNVWDLAEVLHLRHLPQMRVLWLSDNPCAQLPHYRQYIVQHVPWITKIDSQDVTDNERRQAAQTDLAHLPTKWSGCPGRGGEGAAGARGAPPPRVSVEASGGATRNRCSVERRLSAPVFGSPTNSDMAWHEDDHRHPFAATHHIAVSHSCSQPSPPQIQLNIGAHADTGADRTPLSSSRRVNEVPHSWTPQGVHPVSAAPEPWHQPQSPTVYGEQRLPDRCRSETLQHYVVDDDGEGDLTLGASPVSRRTPAASPVSRCLSESQRVFGASESPVVHEDLLDEELCSDNDNRGDLQRHRRRQPQQQSQQSYRQLHVQSQKPPQRNLQETPLQPQHEQAEHQRQHYYQSQPHRQRQQQQPSTPQSSRHHGDSSPKDLDTPRSPASVDFRDQSGSRDNILCAVLALVQELDCQGLQLVQRSLEQRQQLMQMNT
eukprot:gnl/TRDRNA2_/TRDRNA2_43980_c0_seq1.p1 gnl/TRDRNA2_/TRDRNA2_43980_c0~~gnl/TRDRNA2_/TRDRNA2_43980_c0_seq1.p1  ORF type:complete len:552 (-),score=82.22 gnl/TRDRNA2_/TRDRNA2_43980_c0_seq1:95-1582(-)